MYKYIYYAIAINEKRSHEFEGKWEEAYGRAWRKENEGGNTSIQLQA